MLVPLKDRGVFLCPLAWSWGLSLDLLSRFCGGHRAGFQVWYSAECTFLPALPLGPRSLVPSGVRWGAGNQSLFPTLVISGREPAVSNMQDHLWGEDGDAATGEDGVPPHPALPARPPRLQDHPHHLQHPAWHSGEPHAFLGSPFPCRPP